MALLLQVKTKGVNECPWTGGSVEVSELRQSPREPFDALGSDTIIHPITITSPTFGARQTQLN
jgi:hypothetical protein